MTLKHFDANSLEGQVRILLTRLIFSSAASESCFLLHDLSQSAGDDGLTRMTVDVNVSKYLLADYYWPAFRASIRDGKAKGVMCSCGPARHCVCCLCGLVAACVGPSQLTCAARCRGRQFRQRCADLPRPADERRAQGLGLRRVRYSPTSVLVRQSKQRT